MKTPESKIIVMVGCLLLLFAPATFSQTHFRGNWEGLFMNDFKTIVEFKVDKNDNYSGKIQMFSGNNLIQDDEITKISISQNFLTFKIESKNTEFKGEFNNEFSELEGNFIFPDNSLHPIKLLKIKDSKSTEINQGETYLYLKTKKYSIDELKQDLNYLVEQLEQNHPQLYRYISKEKFYGLIDLSMQSIDSELTVEEYFNMIAPIIESIKCSHTGIRLPENYQKGIHSSGNFLPLKLLLTGNKAFCISNYSNSEILPGNEILSINNISIQNIKEKLYKYVPSDGDNETTKDYKLNHNFNSYYFLIDNSNTFEIEYLNSDTKLKTSVKACKYSEVNENNEVARDEMPIEFFLSKENKVGRLTVKSFMIGDINKYIQKMDGIFQLLHNEKIQNLILDLRGNSGGHPIFAAQLLSYLTDKEFTYFERNNDVKEFEPLYNKMQPNKIQFEGNIYVFVDGGCLSATGHFISLLKYHTNAIFIGEELGSTFSCNDFSVKVTSPNTKIEANIPRTTFETAIDEKEKMNSFTLDYNVNISIEDYLSGTDSYVELANALIGKP
jgi:C-terminal processing protease CtpA/Prc